MKISSIQLTNYRCFESVKIDFDDHVTVLAANNGHGKSAILDAIATSLSPFVSQFEYGALGKKPSITRDDARRFRIFPVPNASLFKTEVKYPVLIECDFHTGFHPQNPDHIAEFSSCLRLDTAGGRMKTKAASILSNYGDSLNQRMADSGQQTLLPLIAYYGTGRLFSHQKLTSGKRQKEGTLESSRTTGYLDCLSPNSTYKHFVDWMRKWTFEDLQQRQKAKEGEQATFYYGELVNLVSRAVEKCLFDSKFQQLQYSIGEEELRLITPNGNLSLAQLSDGIRNIVTLVGDIAFRLLSLNPGIYKPLENISGIVLIDEIDMHLHPCWQQRILMHLGSVFPKIQFIVTTHSPQVLSTLSKERIRLIDGNEVREPTVQTLGFESGDILTRLMNVDPLPQSEIREKVSRLTEMIETGIGDSSEAKKIDNELIEHFGKDHPKLLELSLLRRVQDYKKILA